MVFKAEKTSMSKNIILVMIVLILGLGTFLRFANKIHVQSFLLSMILLILVIGNYYVVLINTLYFKIDKGFLTIGNIFRFNDVIINLKEIEYYTERITLINQSGLAGLFSKRFSVGKGYIEGIGKVNMYITSSKKAIYFTTSLANYAISPENPNAFIAMLKKENIPEKSVFHDILENDLIKSEDTIRQYFLFDALLIAIVVSIPVVLYYRNYLPPYISSSIVAPKVISFIPSKVFIESVIRYGVMNFGFLLLFMIISKIYSKIDRIYYYRMMIIPTLVTFFFMLYVINMILPIFT
ncbi:MAG: PH domain-containing protein [Clostridiaceae bacterium]